MTDAHSTQHKLITQARALFWTRGYSNVGLREIAKGAGVDVALISRYFGGKKGLFDATLEEARHVDFFGDATRETLVDAFEHLLVSKHHSPCELSVLDLLLTNVSDADVGETVRAMLKTKLEDPLAELLGNTDQVTLFMSVVLGVSVMEKTSPPSGQPKAHSADYTRQVRHLLDSALQFKSGS